MDANHVEAAINFPNLFPRFCGQGFLEREDKELSLDCVKIYNDWMIDEWGGGAGRGRLIPLTLIPLWDPQLAADEVRRCAGKGSHAIAFSENPSPLGLPSLYSGAWDVLWAACEETETTVSMHIGSSSKMPSTAPDAPAGDVDVAVRPERPGIAVRLGLLRHPVAVPRDQDHLRREPGRLDAVPARADGQRVARRCRRHRAARRRPASRCADGCSAACSTTSSGLRYRDDVGLESILFETDYPHSDGTFPHSRKVAHDLFSAAGMDADACHKVLRDNAIDAYGLDRFGVTE